MCSIEIVEKYKFMPLEGHNQAQKKKNRQIGLGQQHAPTQHYSTTQAGRTGTSM